MSRSVAIGIESFREQMEKGYYYVDKTLFIKTLFDGLAISKEKQLCGEWMNKRPVIFLSLKGVEGLSFEICWLTRCGMKMRKKRPN